MSIQPIVYNFCVCRCTEPQICRALVRHTYSRTTLQLEHKLSILGRTVISTRSKQVQYVQGTRQEVEFVNFFSSLKSTIKLCGRFWNRSSQKLHPSPRTFEIFLRADATKRYYGLLINCFRVFPKQLFVNNVNVPDHDGGRPIEVNACILITHMVYL